MSEFDFHQLESMTFPELLVDLEHEANVTVQALKIQRDPDAIKTRYFFDLESSNCLIPQVVRDQLGSCTPYNLVVETDINYAEAVCTIRFEIEFSSPTTSEPITCHIEASKDRVGTAIIFGEDLDAFYPPDQCSVADMNRLLASIYAPNKRGDYSAFDALDLFNFEICENIGQALENNTSDTLSKAAFLLPDFDQGIHHCIEYEEADSNITSVTVTQGLVGGKAIKVCLGDEQAEDSVEGIRMYESPTLLDTSKEIDCSTSQVISFIDFLKELRRANSDGYEEIPTDRLDTISDSTLDSNSLRLYEDLNQSED